MLIGHTDQSIVNTDSLREILRIEEEDVFIICFFFQDSDKESAWVFGSEEERDRVFRSLQTALAVQMLS